MHSVRFYEFGDPAVVLRVEDAPQPEPGANEVLVKMRARPINPSDLLTVRGLYGALPKLPATPGLEGMGEVAAVGDGVKNLGAGQRVIPLGISGTWQEYLLAQSAQLIPVPESVSDQTAAQFVVNPLTAWIMTVEELRLQPGEWLLQTAAGSTLGRVVLQIAALRGFKTINVVRRREQVEELKALGADEVICTADEDLVERVREITGRAGITKAIDAVGGETGGAVVSTLSRGGMLLVYGLLSMEPMPVDSGRMIFTSATIRGFWLSEWFRTTLPERQQAVTVELLRLMTTNEIVPPVEAEYPLTDVLAAVEHAQRPGRSGKVLLTEG
ncbi:MAG TPA: zinc-dependent alcohol dehydrogenase family protein [Pyrinomonadaceae bacterium]|jgi:NADPH:quinone reductase-like Zn-dependent oxidoreductase|nr:zinc-dependent alcohol dehydrogenase family protein [Pyrinomonadaceae bacterium]